ncbi:hypothetical protein CVT24_003495 [Panaeolus cyanescens]|uniref:Uncharacterized protein n=1 Tax=Panaeolus cyanescens TaxID=181874 RepID=A0A409Y7Y1_9AGAR|nr:hypothetical protein CVT24_003495 [Panaeolus cyanescens]
MNTRRISTASNSKRYPESLGLRRAGTISTDTGVHPNPLNSSNTFNSQSHAQTAKPASKRYSSLRIRLRNRWGAENSPPTATVITRSVSSTVPSSSTSNECYSPSVYSTQDSSFEEVKPTIKRPPRPSEVANMNNKPLPDIMIRFCFHGAPKTTQGMPMDWLVDPKVKTEDIEASMKGGTDRVLDDERGDKILLRIIWMPYVADIWYSIPILNDYSNPISRAELARRIARTYQSFMQVCFHHTRLPSVC